MAEYIEREALKNNLHFTKEGIFYHNGKAYMDLNVVDKIVLETPTADVVKVIRCKDCVNRVEFDTNKFHCELTGYYCGETGYCSDGTPKERGGEK